MAVVLLRARRRNQKLEFHSDRLLASISPSFQALADPEDRNWPGAALYRFEERRSTTCARRHGARVYGQDASNFPRFPGTFRPEYRVILRAKVLFFSTHEEKF